MARMYLPPSIPEDASEDQLFDPSDHKVDDVNAYLDTADAAEVARVLEAEAAGKARQGIVEGPHAEDDEPEA